MIGWRRATWRGLYRREQRSIAAPAGRVACCLESRRLDCGLAEAIADLLSAELVTNQEGDRDGVSCLAHVRQQRREQLQLGER